MSTLALPFPSRITIDELPKTSTALLLVIAVFCLMFSAACTPQEELTVVNDIGKFIPAITDVGEAICGFVPGAPICIGAITAASASAKILQTALQNYYTAEVSGTVPPGIVAALSQAISTFEAAAGNILGAVHVVDPVHVSEVEAIAAAAQVLLAVIESLLPAAATASAQLRFSASKPSKPWGFKELNSWAGDFNVKVDATQRKLPRNVSLQHVHTKGLFLHIATVGILK